MFSEEGGIRRRHEKRERRETTLEKEKKTLLIPSAIHPLTRPTFWSRLTSAPPAASAAEATSGDARSSTADVIDGLTYDLDLDHAALAAETAVFPRVATKPRTFRSSAMVLCAFEKKGKERKGEGEESRAGEEGFLFRKERMERAFSFERRSGELEENEGGAAQQH